MIAALPFTGGAVGLQWVVMHPASPSLAILGLGPAEIALILFLILLLFGAKRLPELARGFGKSIREFKKATAEVEDDLRSAMEDPPKGAGPAAKANPPPPAGKN
jgi:sec-independent protein translocase protein TatA